jgi:hypothetical protein
MLRSRDLTSESEPDLAGALATREQRLSRDRDCSGNFWSCVPNIRDSDRSWANQQWLRPHRMVRISRLAFAGAIRRKQ